MQIHSERVIELRKSRGWTQQQLAEIANLSLRTVQRVEKQRNASQETLSALAAVFEVEREQLIPRKVAEISIPVPIYWLGMGLAVLLGFGIGLIAAGG